MQVNLHTYVAIKKQIPFFLNKYQGREISYVANLICLATGVPVVVIYYYIGEIIGFTPEINKGIELLKEFYGYKKIVGEEDYVKNPS